MANTTWDRFVFLNATVLHFLLASFCLPGRARRTPDELVDSAFDTSIDPSPGSFQVFGFELSKALFVSFSADTAFSSLSIESWRIERTRGCFESKAAIRARCAGGNPYVDPMHLIQIDMLRRKRAGEDTPEVNRAIAATISGVEEYWMNGHQVSLPA